MRGIKPLDDGWESRNHRIWHPRHFVKSNAFLKDPDLQSLGSFLIHGKDNINFPEYKGK